MSDSALNVWKEIYKIDNVKDKTSFEAIDLLLNGFSASKRNKILVEVFSTFKSTFIAYRFIYFNFIKEKIPEDEKVKVLNPYDLELIDVKNNIDFQKVKKPSGSGFKQGSSMCPLVFHWFMTTDSTNATQEHPTLNVAHSLLMNAKVMMEGFLKVGGLIQKTCLQNGLNQQ